jgi:DNA uptake protein ComE-like DNA-binding protein
MTQTNKQCEIDKAQAEIVENVKKISPKTAKAVTKYQDEIEKYLTG